MGINIHIVNAIEFYEATHTQDFLDNIDENIYIVREMFDVSTIQSIRLQCMNTARETEPSWHPCLDNCPDYHRIHHNYPDAYVKSIQHAHYFHPWNTNLKIFDTFLPIFELKVRLCGYETAEVFLSNIPSSGPICRVLVHQYPSGGGGQQEHIDPVSPFAQIQTIIQASEPGKDFGSGGLYVNHSKIGKIYLDSLTQVGDLIVLSPGVKHGVAPIDIEKSLNWNEPTGRWIVMPIIIDSDEPHVVKNKPIGV